MKKEIEAFNNEIEQILDWRCEYESTHDDAGNNYAYLVREGDTFSMRDRLKEYLTTTKYYSPSHVEPLINAEDLTEDLLEDIFDRVLDQFEMESGHIFSGGDNGNRFVLDSFSVGEIEEQIEPSMVQSIPAHRFPLYARYAAERDRTNCVRWSKHNPDLLLGYQCTDAVWLAVIKFSDLKQIVEDAINDSEE